MKRRLFIKRKYLEQIKSGKKTIEIRVGYSQIKKIQAGDIVNFGEDKTNFLVKDVRQYKTFKEALNNEDIAKALPGFSYESALKTYYRLYPKHKEAMGVYAIELKKLN